MSTLPTPPEDTIPFMLAGHIESWDPDTRVLWIGHVPLYVAPDVQMEAFGPGDVIIASGYYPKGSRTDTPGTVRAVQREPPLPF